MCMFMYLCYPWGKIEICKRPSHRRCDGDAHLCIGGILMPISGSMLAHTNAS